MEKVDCVVIGAGVVGLAVARKMSQEGREVIVLEATGAIGTGTSSRNSEVIHAGIYYPPNSLKATLCVAGREAMYRYAREHSIPHARVGKLLVATDETQHATLKAVADNAARNGVRDLTPLDTRAVRGLEPALHATAALWSPSTGIIDTHAFMLSLQGEAESHGTMIAFNAPVTGGAVADGGLMLSVGGAEPMELLARTVVNSSGLDALAVAASLRGYVAHQSTGSFYAKGNYFSLQGVKLPFRHLIYPMPDDAGLGIHLTLDLAGRGRFGPDVEWVNERRYEVNCARADYFYQAVRRYWPDLPDGSLVPDYAGIRPKIVGPGVPSADFVIQGPDTHGVPGLVNLLGIESPGITASLALADVVWEELG
jgi:L-2-hydroxyglutarate oxidase LhgO